MTKVIIGAGYHDPAVQQIRACADGGLVVEVYRYLFWGRPMREQVKYALSIVKSAQRPVGRLWLDAEDPVIWTVAEMLVRLREAKRAAGKMPIGIYTRRSWWQIHLKDSRAFAKLPLWDAHFNGAATLDDFDPYGGWKRSAMKQYAENVIFAGERRVDLNVYEEAG